jgi:hypothetical protein
MTDSTTLPSKCGYCGLTHENLCPMIKAIEYFPDGTVKAGRVPRNHGHKLSLALSAYTEVS